MSEASQPPGLVSLVGAGPGDPGLLTLRGLRALERADVVLYDRLADPALLAGIPVAAQERIHVGKTAGAGLSQQVAINQLLVEHALAGRRVVRLKGGDPTVFGRGGEEAQACVAAGVPFEIIAGVSSVAAAPASAGIPLTHRDFGASFTVVTGHERAGASRARWREVATTGGTIVVLMGVLQARQWAQALLDGGLDAQTPVAFVRWATTPRQKTLVATLSEVAAEGVIDRLRPPAVAIVGPIVELRGVLQWREQQPLFGQVIGLGRSRRGDLRRFEAVTDLGARLLHIPLTQQRLRDDGRLAQALTAGSFTDLVVTSANGVTALAQAQRAAGLDSRSLAGVRTWAVGPASARALRDALGVRADHVPDDARATGLVELAARVGVAGARFLFPAAAAARRELPDGLTALGATVDMVVAYDTIATDDGAQRVAMALDGGLSLMALASPSAVDAWVAALTTAGMPLDQVPVAAIGPTTAEHAEAAGLRVTVTTRPGERTIDGLAAAIAAWHPRDRASEDSEESAGADR